MAVLRLKHAVSAVVLCVCVLWGPVSLGISPLSEYQVKAVYLFNFLNFVDWPEAVFAHPNSPMNLCILGEDPFDKVIDLTFEGKMVGQRRVIIHRLHDMGLDQACHLLFISASEVERMVGIVGSVHNKPILTIGDVKGFVNLNGMIQFVIVDNKIRFQVNRTAIKNASLYMSANLLRLAQPRSEAE